MRNALRPSFVLAVLLAATPAAAEPVSPWARDGAAALRLVDAGRAPETGARLAAIAIRLEPGWKTYWRQPGASGVPPRFDFTGSSNVAEAKVLFPAPERDASEDGVTNVYHGFVTLPVSVKPRDPKAPVDLKLVADYGVCERICVPVRAEADLVLSPDGGAAGPAAEEAQAAAVASPRPAPLGAKGDLGIEAVRRIADAKGQAALEIVAAAPAGSDPTLFAETGEGDYAPAPEPDGAAKDGVSRFRMVFEEPELPKSGLRLTLAAGGRAIETAVALDEIAPSP